MQINEKAVGIIRTIRDKYYALTSTIKTFCRKKVKREKQLMKEIYI